MLYLDTNKQVMLKTEWHLYIRVIHAHCLTFTHTMHAHDADILSQ